MKRESLPYKEVSNIMDVKYSHDALFPLFYVARKAGERFRKLLKKKEKINGIS